EKEAAWLYLGPIVCRRRRGEKSETTGCFQGGQYMAKTRVPLSSHDEASKSQKTRLEMSTAEIGLTVRTTNCLEERGIFTVRDLLNSTPDQLLSIANFGEKTLEEVYKALEKFGFYRRSRQKAMA